MTLVSRWMDAPEWAMEAAWTQALIQGKRVSLVPVGRSVCPRNCPLSAFQSPPACSVWKHWIGSPWRQLWGCAGQKRLICQDPSFLTWETNLSGTTMGWNQGKAQCAVMHLCCLPGVRALLRWQLCSIVPVWEKNMAQLWQAYGVAVVYNGWICSFI